MAGFQVASYPDHRGEWWPGTYCMYMHQLPHENRCSTHYHCKLSVNSYIMEFGSLPCRQSRRPKLLVKVFQNYLSVSFRGKKQKDRTTKLNVLPFTYYQRVQRLSSPTHNSHDSPHLILEVCHSLETRFPSFICNKGGAWG